MVFRKFRKFDIIKLRSKTKFIFSDNYQPSLLSLCFPSSQNTKQITIIITCQNQPI